MRTIIIGEPIWKTNSVGIDIKKLEDYGDHKLEIAYKNKKGVKVYPDTYKINSQLVLSYPYQTMTRKNVNLKIIPIKDLEVYDG